MIEQRLLKIRMAALEVDVEKVENVVRKACQRTVMIERIADDLKAQEWPLKRVRNTANRIIGDLEISPEISENFAKQGESEELDSLMKDLRDRVDAVRALHERVTAAVQQIAGELVSLTGETESELAQHIRRCCTDLRKRLRLVQEGLEASTEPAEYRKRWQEFDTLLESEARQLFAEYVDFVGGLAVRDNALDDQVCAMTDRLLEELPLKGLLAVPAQQAALGQVMQSVIKLGFPEWTIWGIPLVGHEVGLKIPLNHDEFGALLGDGYPDGLTATLRKSLFADIFAAYTLGPCYAYSVIQLRLEPHRGRPRGPDEPLDEALDQPLDQPLDEDRAELILTVLDRLATLDPGHWSRGRLDERYRATVKDLREFWRREVGDGPAEDGERSKELRRFLDKALDQLAETPYQPFSQQRWGEAQDLVAYLTGPDAPQSMPSILSLLTASWEARVAASEHAADLLRRAAALPAAPRTRLDLLDLLLGVGEDEIAGRLAEEALAAEPGAERALAALVKTLLRRNDDESLDAAERRLAGFLRAHPDSAEAESWLGETYRRRGRPKDALAHFDRALDAGGGRTDARAAFLHGGKGQAFLQLGRWKEGVAELREAIGRGPDIAWIRFALVDAYRMVGDLRTAGAELRELIARTAPTRDRATWVAAMGLLGDLLVETGDWAEAEAVLRRIPEPEALSVDVLKPLTDALLDGGHEEQALAALRHAARAAPDDLSVRTLHARVLYRLRRLDEAAELLADVLCRDGDRWRDRAWLGEIERLRGNLPAALEQLDRVLHDHPDNIWTLSSRAAVHLRMNEPKKAEEDLRFCLDRAPGDLFSLRTWRDLLIPQHRHRELLDRFRRAVAAPDADAGLWQEYGNTLRMLAAQREAAEALDGVADDLLGALEKRPHDLKRLRVLRDLLVGRGRLADATRAFEQAVDSPEPASTELWREYGETLRQVGKFPEARQALDQALWQAGEKQIPPIRYVLGRLLLDEQKYEEAVTVLDEAYRDPRHPTAWYEGCVARILAGRYVEARDRLDAWLRARPGDMEAWWLLGWLYQRVGAFRQAMEAARTAVAHDPEDAQKQELLGWSALRTGAEFPAALAAFGEAVKLEPTRLSAMAGRARALWLAGRDREARTAFEEIVDLLPGDGREEWIVLVVRAWCLARLGRRREAVADYVRSLAQLAEGRVAAEVELAVCQLEAGRVADAESAAEQAWRELEERHPRRGGLASQLGRRGVLATVQQDLRGVLAHDPALSGLKVFADLQDRVAEELRSLPEIGPGTAGGERT